MPSYIRRRESKASGKVSWAAQFPVGEDDDGNTRFIRQTFDKKRDAQRWIEGLKAERETGGVIEPSTMKLGEYLDKWLKDAAAPSLRANTLESYRNVIEYYIIGDGGLGDVVVSKLTPMQVQSAYAKLQAKGLSPRIVRYAHSVLHNALEQAVSWRMLSRNPTHGVKLPKKQKAEILPLTAEEARDFLAVAEGRRLAPLLELSLVTGMRPGEVFGLQWADVELDAGLVRVRHSLSSTKDGPTLSTPKTARGVRTIPIPERTVATLRAWRKTQAEERMNAGALWQGSPKPSEGFVFTQVNGAPLERRNVVNRAFKPVVRDLRKL